MFDAVEDIGRGLIDRRDPCLGRRVGRGPGVNGQRFGLHLSPAASSSGGILWPSRRSTAAAHSTTSGQEIGRASCRARVRTYGKLSEGDVTVKKKTNTSASSVDDSV